MLPIAAHRGLVARWLLAVLSLSLIFPAAPALAIQGIGVSPTSQTIDLAPGASATGQLTAINDGDSDVTYHVYATDYGVKGEVYQGVFTATGASKDQSAISWFTLPSGNFTMHGHDQLAVPYTITVPKTAAIGGHYATVFVETVPPTGQQGTYIARIQRLGSIFYITVKGDLNQQGAIESFTASPLQLTTPLQATLRIKNNGNVHFLVDGSLQLSTAFGRSGKPVAFHGEVLPSTIRRFELAASSGPLGIYHLTATVNYLGRTEHVARYVVVAPLITLIVVGATLLLLVGILVIWLRRRQTKL